jgi:hypothetical protein
MPQEINILIQQNRHHELFESSEKKNAVPSQVVDIKVAQN